MTRCGPTNTLTDVPGVRVGHDTRIGDGWLTGTTVVTFGPEGAVAGVDVRGGGPGTRETDTLDPRMQVTHVHAVVLTGGSSFGLSAVDGVMRSLLDAGVGFPVGGPGEVVPIVPAAVIFDLGRGGVFGNHPGPEMGRAAYAAASAGAVEQGVVGAGAGAKAGEFKGGLGSASVVLADGSTVAALVVVNAVGSTVDRRTGELHGARFALDGEIPPLRRPDAAEFAAAKGPLLDRDWLSENLATTIGVIATDASLTKAQCAKIAGVGHDGLARAINPVHTMFDGDTLFTVSTQRRPAPSVLEFHRLLEAAGDCVTRAVVHAVLAAQTVVIPGEPPQRVPSYRDTFPSAFEA